MIPQTVANRRLRIKQDGITRTKLKQKTVFNLSSDTECSEGEKTTKDVDIENRSQTQELAPQRIEDANLSDKLAFSLLYWLMTVHKNLEDCMPIVPDIESDSNT